MNGNLMRWAIVTLMLIWVLVLQIVGPLTTREIIFVACALVGVNLAVQAIQYRQARKHPRMSPATISALVAAARSKIAT